MGTDTDIKILSTKFEDPNKHQFLISKCLEIDISKLEFVCDLEFRV